MSWAVRMARNTGGILHLEIKFPDESEAYYIFQVDTDKREALDAKIANKEAFDLNDYGAVLESGWGPLPDKDADNQPVVLNLKSDALIAEFLKKHKPE